MPRRAVTGPILLIVVGFVFLLHTLRPAIPVALWFARGWPYLLIAWGTLQLVEVLVRSNQRRSLPVNGVSGASWVAVVVVCLLGLVSFHTRRPGLWWRDGDFFINSFGALGQEHEFAVPSQQHAAGAKPHIVIENFRGDAKISAGADGLVVLSGRKLVRVGTDSEAAAVNSASPVELISQGDSVVVRCHQDGLDNRARVTTNLELVVPREASVTATGRVGDFEINGLTGNVDLRSDNAGVRLADITGSVQVATRRSDLVRCNGITGSVRLVGHGEDVELNHVRGPVDVTGNFTGQIALRSLLSMVHISNFHNELTLQSLPGEVRFERGQITMQNIAGPAQLKARATDVKVDGFSNQLHLDLDKGDIELRPVHGLGGPVAARTTSGNIDMELPQAAGCALQARTRHGDITNDLSDSLRPSHVGAGAQLQGTLGAGAGPNVQLETVRGSINLRRLDRTALVSQTAGQNSPDEQDDDR